MRAVMHMAMANTASGMNAAAVIAVMPKAMSVISVMAVIRTAIVIAIIRSAIIRVIPVIG